MKTKFLFALVFFATGFTSFSQITLTLQPGPLDGKDATIRSEFPNLNMNNHDFIANAWTANGDSFVMRSFIDFDLSQLPPNATIISAHLSLYGNPQSGHPQLHSSLSGPNTSELHRITSLWGETSVTWNSQPTTDSTNKVILPQATSTTQNYLNIDVTSHIQMKVSNPTSHYGFMLKLATEYKYRCMVFASSDHTNPYLRPRLVILYDTITPPPAPCPGYHFIKTEICQGDSVLLQGSYQKVSGLYFDTLSSSAYQDSIIVTALYVHYPFYVAANIEICKGDSVLIGGLWCSAPAIYPVNYISVNGCDSIVNVQLSHYVLDSSVSVSGITLTANQAGAFYQWLDCELGFSVIPGATSQSFTPAVNGSYAVMIFKGGCMTISPCFHVGNISVQQLIGSQYVKLLPNPSTSEAFTVLFDRPYSNISIVVYNSLGGVMVRRHEENADRIEISSVSWAKGQYVVHVNAAGELSSHRLIIH
jgi:hypothetical protein